MLAFKCCFSSLHFLFVHFADFHVYIDGFSCLYWWIFMFILMDFHVYIDGFSCLYWWIFMFTLMDFLPDTQALLCCSLVIRNTTHPLYYISAILHIHYTTHPLYYTSAILHIRPTSTWFYSCYMDFWPQLPAP